MNKILVLIITLIITHSASASLTSSYQFNGNGNWSVDAIGSTNSAIGDLRALVPTGSTIEKAFLYQTTYENTTALDLTFGGTLITGASWIDLGTITALNLTAFRAAVTTQVAVTVGAGDNVTPFTLSAVESSSKQEGAALVVVYSRPNESVRTIALLDGNTNPAGDTTSINLADPLTAAQLAAPTFEAQMSLGIGYGSQGSDQFSTVDVNGVRLTTSAGGQDDGSSNDGALITVGDVFDDDFSTNPANAFGLPTGPRTDDEAYNLIGLLTTGDTVIQIDTTNPSFNDNIFFAGFNITAVAGVNQEPLQPVFLSLPQ